MASTLNVAIVSAVRSAVGRAHKGALKDTRPDDLAAQVLRAALGTHLPAASVEDVTLGCAMPEAEQGLNIARMAVLRAEWPVSVPAQTVNRFCSSGLQAIVSAAQAIQLGLIDVAVAGGVESMSLVPMGGNKVRGNPWLSAHCPDAYVGMGHTAERVAQKFDISRQAQDEFSLRSQEKAATAIKNGWFKDELVTVEARRFEAGNEAHVPFASDECPRPETTIEKLSVLKPVFSAKGTVTPGNSSPLSDGAAACLLVSDRKLAALGKKPLGRLRGFAVVGVEPGVMGIGPVPAIRALLQQTGLRQEQIDLFEINEAFAAQAAYCQRELGIPHEKLNAQGGAIALGHPLGATGAKLTATLLHALKRRGGRYGVVSMCIGGGMGAAALFETGA